MSMGETMRALCRAVAVGVALVAAAGRAAAQGVSLADHVLAATVGISTTTADGASFTGTGTVLTPAGHILTSTGAVPSDAASIKVTFPAYVIREAKLLASDAALGVSLVKVEADGLASLGVARGLPPLGTLAYTASDVDRVLLSNGRASFSRGLVSGLYEVSPQGESPYAGPVIETTAAVNPGSDGGPLVDASGRLCGVISLGVSPLRWQGVAVPVAVLLEKFAPLAAATLPLDFEPPAGLADDPAARAAARQGAALRQVAEGIAPALVGIEVARTFPPEELPRISWDAHRRTIPGWDKLSQQDKLKRFMAFATAARMLEVNQLLRRPAGSVTGLVVAPDGLVLTSLFNLGVDNAFLAKSTGQPPAVDPHAEPAQLLAEPAGGWKREANPITGLTVVLPDGGRLPARELARHEPLGVALVKVEAADLPWYDFAAASTSPLLGDAVAVVGRSSGGPADFTLNEGMVSAPARNRGYQFQTDALLNYGNSGGPVIDVAGNFLGIATAPLEPDTVLGRVIPPPELIRWTRAPNSGVGMVARADRIRGALDALREGKSFAKIPGPYLGVQPDMARAFGEDVWIGGVLPRSPADRAGLRKGDRLLEIDGVEIHTWRELTERITAGKAGDRLTLLVQRKGRGPRLVIAGRDIESLADLEQLKKSLRPEEPFEGLLTSDDTREIEVVLEEQR